MSVTEKSWTYNLELKEIERSKYCNFELNLNELCRKPLKILEDGFNQSSSYQINKGQSYDDDLKILLEKNKQLRQEIDSKIKEVSQQKTQYENYKQDQKLLSQEIKETHEAFLMAKKYYKKFLKMYYCIESRTEDKNVIFIQFFTEAKKESENYSVRLIWNTKSKQYELLGVTPTLKNWKELQRILKDTNDVPGVLYSIREEFLALKRARK